MRRIAAGRTSVILLAASFATVTVSANPPGAPRTPTPLAVAGFGASESLDARDTWIPTALEETLTWRLRRVPGINVIPTTRTQQARRDLAESDGAPPAEWARVVRLLGAKRWLRGTCAGTPTGLTLDLELTDPADPEARPERAHIGPERLFSVLDEATRWTLSRLDIARISKTVDELIFAPPCKSPSALEYYAKGVTAARDGRLADGLYYAAQAIDYDRAFLPALALMAKIELFSPAVIRARAEFHLRQIETLASARNDAVGLADFQLAHGQALLMERSFDPARRAFESAFASSTEREDAYGQIAAARSMCELWLNHTPPPAGETLSETTQRQQAQDLRRAAEWQIRVLETARQVGDVIAELPASNKLALIYERLDEPQLALETHKQTLAAARKTGSTRNEATGWLFLGQCHRRQKRYDEALDAVNRCLALATGTARSTVHIELAKVYREMPRPKEALRQYEIAYDLLEDGDETLMSRFTCLRAIAELRMDLGERQVAIGKLQEALDIAQVRQFADEQAVREQLEGWKSDKP